RRRARGTRQDRGERHPPRHRRHRRPGDSQRGEPVKQTTALGDPRPAGRAHGGRIRPGIAPAADQAGMAGALIALVLRFAATAPHFRTVVSLLDVARPIPGTAILGAGVSFVIMAAGIDLWVGSAVGVTARFAVWPAIEGFPPAIAVLAAIAA